MGRRRSYLGNSLLRYSVLKILESRDEMDYLTLSTAISEAIKDDIIEVARLGTVLPTTLSRMSISKLIERSGGRIRITDEGREELRKMDLFLSRLKEAIP
jgi:DNA-binding PadR family transcriptional regulator